MSDIELCQSVFVTLTLAGAGGGIQQDFNQQIAVNFCPDVIALSDMISRIVGAGPAITAYVTTNLPIKSQGATVAAPNNTAQVNFGNILFAVTMAGTSGQSIENVFQVSGQNNYINNTYTFSVADTLRATAITAVGQISFRLDFIKYRLQKETTERPSEPILSEPDYIKKIDKPIMTGFHTRNIH
ncbi:MAG: hypothetical protein ACYC3F_16650 [Gemmatimonadaceae bacterium]